MVLFQRGPEAKAKRISEFLHNTAGVPGLRGKKKKSSTPTLRSGPSIAVELLSPERGAPI
jgi:hypothetical protein